MKRKLIISLAAVLAIVGAPAIAYSDEVQKFFQELLGVTVSYDEKTNVITRENKFKITETLSDGTTVEHEHISHDVIENATFRDRFFMEARTSQFTPEELEKSQMEHPSSKDSLPWEERIKGCDTVSTYEKFFDCMYRPWIYGF